MKLSLNERENIISEYSFDKKIVSEILNYNQNKFIKITDNFKDELFVSEWKSYSEQSKEYSVAEILQKYIIQFSFPVKSGISQDAEYIKAVRTGKRPVFSKCLHEFNEPERITLTIHKSPAGNIPVIYCENREDFENMLRIFLYKNEPEDIPVSQGACFIKGFNNWSRIDKIKQKWISDGNNEEDWLIYFKENIVSHRELYQDKFIILSNSPYSGVSSDKIGMREDKWKDLSYIIRREHEICHYYTLRRFGYMANNMLDELIADFSGIIEAFGEYRSDVMLWFLGFENFPEVRKTGRFNNYFLNKEISEESIVIIKQLVYNSIKKISYLCKTDNNINKNSKYEFIDYLCTQTLESLSK